jgi:hypothetical protein
MKSKAPLALIEQAIMLVVFALAAALCLQAFVWADTQSRQTTLRDQALVQVQSAAEVLKHCGGDFSAAAAIQGGTWDGASWILWYDEDWNSSDGTGTYRLCVTPETSGTAGLGAAQVEAAQADGLSLASLRVCWQEEVRHG